MCTENYINNYPHTLMLIIMKCYEALHLYFLVKYHISSIPFGGFGYNFVLAMDYIRFVSSFREGERE